MAMSRCRRRRWVDVVLMPTVSPPRLTKLSYIHPTLLLVYHQLVKSEARGGYVKTNALAQVALCCVGSPE